MATLLFIQASPRIKRSHSIAVARAFLETYKQTNPDDSIIEFNLFEKDLPTFDLTAANAKYKIMNSKEHSPEEARLWERIVAEIDEFKATDKYLFAIPMWNFSIPWRLKQYIDIIVQPGQTFIADENGYQGLVINKPAVVVYSHGGRYAPGTPTEPYNKQTPYVQQILGFMGITDVTSIIVEPTLAEGPDAAKQARIDAIEKAQQLAKDF